MKAVTRLTGSELAASPVYYLLRVRLGGRTFRLSTRTLHILDDDGQSHVYLGRLRRVDFSDEVDIYSSDAPRRSVPVEFSLPVDVAALLAAGHTLDRADAELSRWVEGRTEERRDILIAGRLEEPSAGLNGEPVVATLVDEPMRESSLWPPPSWIVNDTTWSSPAPNAVGRWYPTPFGRPGMLYDDESSRRRPATRAYLVDTSGTTDVPFALLVAGGPAYLDDVAVYNNDGEAINTGNLQRMQDGLGQTVTVFEMDPADLGAPDYSIEWWIAPRTGGPGYGILGDMTSGQPMRGLGDVISWALRRSGILVDWAQVEAQRQRLNRYHVDGAIEERVNLWRWLQDNVIGVFPVWIAGGPRGIRVGLIDAAAAATFHLRIPRDGIRDGAPTFDRSTIHNAVTLRYGLDRVGDHHQHVSAQTPEPDASVEHAVPSAYIAASRARYGVIGEQQLAADLISEQATATQILLHSARHRGMGVRGIVYRCRRRWQAIRAGDVGRLTDDGLGWSNLPVICRRVTPQESDVVVEVAHVVDPIRSPT